MHPARLPIAQLLEDCDERRLRRGGPGGQHRNKVETAVELTHRPTGVGAEANERRSQQQNREVALGRLRLRLALAIREEEEYWPSELWVGRCRGTRIEVSPRHDDFPALLAEALDVLNSVNWDTSAAVERLGITTSQLVKLLKLEPAALKMLNEQRGRVGLKPLN